MQASEARKLVEKYYLHSEGASDFDICMNFIRSEAANGFCGGVYFCESDALKNKKKFNKLVKDLESLGYLVADVNLEYHSFEINWGDDFQQKSG